MAYTAGEIRRAGGSPGGRPWGRGACALGCALYLLHVVAAFTFHHGWSHQAAYASTAEQTAALIGQAWGGGLYLNYAFTALWIGETVCWWASPHAYGTRSRTATLTVRAVFLFMIVNGAVVFVDGPMRWVGAGIVAVLLATWMSRA